MSVMEWQADSFLTWCENSFLDAERRALFGSLAMGDPTQDAKQLLTRPAE